jgi:pSer/pThr/pTyr-binding forkhead associated (FHA) protein
MMEVKLVVVHGARAGEEVPVAGPKFYIGRAEDCQLRPRSDLVSRHHCVLIVEKDYAAVRDFGSKNGTVVNDETIKGEQELRNGDRLKVGDLEFEVRLDLGVGGKKKPKVQSIQEAAARTVDASTEDDMDLDSWLSDTDTQTLEPTLTDGPSAETSDTPTVDDEPPLPDEKRKKKKKPTDVVGVWNKGRWKPSAENPRDAAADTLKDFFKKHPQ